MAADLTDETDTAIQTAFSNQQEPEIPTSVYIILFTNVITFRCKYTSLYAK